MERIRFLPMPVRFTLQWHITKTCNYRCKHCYNDDKTSENELTTEEIINGVERYVELIKSWRIPKAESHLSWTGGEPLLRKDFYEILEKCKENQNALLYLVMSNGSTINENVAKDLKYFGVFRVQISMEGLEETNDEIRGRGSFKKALAAIEILRNIGLKTTVSLTLTKKNLNQIFELSEICEKSGANSLGVSRLIPIGRGEDMKDNLVSTAEFRKFLHDMNDANSELEMKNSKFRIVPGCGSPIWIADNLPAVTRKLYYCHSGNTVLTILENGDALSCRRQPLLVGNVRNESIFKIFYGSEKMWQLRNRKNIHPRCRECKFYSRCGGGPKCNSGAYFDNPYAPDPNCWVISEKMLPEDSFPQLPDNPDFEIDRKYLKFLDETEKENAKPVINVIEMSPDEMEDAAKEISEAGNASIAFNINRNNSTGAGEKIKNFLIELENSGTDFKIMKPIPRCLFGLEYQKLASRYKFPESCSECWKFENCETLQKMGAEKWQRKYMNRKQQLEFLSNISKQGEKCSACMWRLRGNCDMPCV